VISRIKQEQQGIALVLSLVLVVIMFSIGVATLAFVGGQRELSSGERVRESAFNLAEAALNSQLFLVSQKWPGSQASAYPAGCSSTAVVSGCPDPGPINAQFTGGDYAHASWTTAVQDNGGGSPDYYSTTVATSQPHYDANSDGKLWIRAQTVTGGVKRTIVTQVSAQLREIPFPRNSVTAGHFSTTNTGRKVVIDTNGSTYTKNPGQPAPVAVRCNSGPKSACLNYDPQKGQVSPPLYQTGFSSSSTVTADELNALRGVARSNNTYYASGCPSSLTGSLVFIENANCSYNTGAVNSLDSLGMVVVSTGTLTLGGNATFYGLVYAANLQNSSGDVVLLQGCAKIIGAVAVDGQGGLSAGSCGVNVAFNANALRLAKGYSQSTAVKGTWREVPG
jgi:Tfp pilus assembly protein PilX